MSDSIKPCCCGKIDQFVVECRALDTKLIMQYQISCGDCGRTVKSELYDECVRIWNTRPIEDALAEKDEEIYRLKKLLRWALPPK